MLPPYVFVKLLEVFLLLNCVIELWVTKIFENNFKLLFIKIWLVVYHSHRATDGRIKCSIVRIDSI